ncbi:TlpA family protein disulfide reductase [Patulibacter americanus]|uniref:TlpA family protein disulfide reductase n=1 Tax=Patulibacter americanus TaxID=588672 RepID=UPI0003B506C5|nr:alkyl hydroperoxide reductase [Patulibacter americanus]
MIDRDDPHPDRPEDDDPFAFAPDERDALETGTTSGPSAGPGSDAEPGTREQTDSGGPVGDPADVAAEREREAARARVAEEAAARRALLADEASRTAQAASTRWLIAGVVLILILAVGSTLLAGRGGDDAQVRPGERLPAFAAPLATRPKLAQDDVNLAQRDDQGQAGRRAACSIRNPSAVTSCALLRDGPLVIVVFSRGVDACLRAVDDVEAVRRALPRLGTLAVATNAEHAEAAEAVRARRWGLPVVYDRDGALASRLGAAVCPLVLFVRRDGSVADRIVGDVTEAGVRVRAERLLRTGATAPAAGTTTTQAAPADGR